MGGWRRPLAACVAAIVASPSHPATTPPRYSRDAAWPLLPPSVRLEGTTGVAVSADGEVFVANHDTPRVMVLSERNGTLLRTWGDSSPSGVCHLGRLRRCCIGGSAHRLELF